MPSGGSGRGQGRPLAAKTVEAMVRKLARTIDRLERQGEPPSVPLTLAAVNLDIQAGRLLRLARMERPVPLTADAQARAAAAVAAIEEDDTPSAALGQAPPMGGKELMMDLYIDAEVVGQESVGTQQQSIVRDNPAARAQGWILMEERHFSPSRGVGMRGAPVQQRLVWGSPALIGSAGQTTWMKVDELLIRFV